MSLDWVFGYLGFGYFTQEKIARGVHKRSVIDVSRFARRVRRKEGR